MNRKFKPYTLILILGLLIIVMGDIYAEESKKQEDDFSNRINLSKSKRSIPHELYQVLVNKELLELGDLKDSWFPGFKQVLLAEDNQKIIDYMKQVINRFPYNMATYGAYMRIGEAYRALGNESEANKWYRKGIDAINVLFERYKDKTESLIFLWDYQLIYSLLTDYTTEDYEREKNIYLTNLSQPLYAEYKDYILKVIAQLYIRQAKFEKALKILEQMDQFYQTQPTFEKNRLNHGILRAQTLYFLGRKDEAIAVLKEARRDQWGFIEGEYIRIIIHEIEESAKDISWPVKIQKQN